MASPLIEARDAAAAARDAGQSALDAAVLEDLLTRYRALAGAGLAANLYRRTVTANPADGARLPLPDSSIDNVTARDMRRLGGMSLIWDRGQVRHPLPRTCGAASFTCSGAGRR